MKPLIHELLPAARRDSRRLMVVLHGLGDSMEGYRWLPDALRLPWLNYLLVNAPDEYFGGYSWYDFASDPGPGVERSYQALAALLDEQRRLGCPTEQTVQFGFSQGCLMTHETGLRYPHRFAGLVGISGYVHEPGRLLAARSPVALEQRFLVTHGRADPMLPVALAREQVKQLQAGGVQIEWHEFDKAHTIAGDEEIRLIRDFLCRQFGES